jgi:hypothetical protein
VPKLVCRCGYVHDLSPIPDAGWITVRDVDYERLIAAEQERETLSARSPRVSPEAYGPADRLVGEVTGLLYDCPDCGRLLWKRPGSKEFEAFQPETPAT